jgi:uncharacterized membrane protein YdjX (TVP38/TMEM64 family)
MKRARIALKLAGILAIAALLVWIETRFRLSATLRPERLDQLLQEAGALAPLVFILAMAVTVVVSPIPSLAFDLLAGRVFGPFVGTLYAALGALLGAVVSFQIARFLGRELIARFLKGHINFCRDCSDRLLTKIVFLSRLIPFVSFDLVSYGAGLTKMSLWKFAVATFVGMLPLTFLYTSFGSVLLLNRWVSLAGGLVMVALFFLLPRWIERHDLFSLRRHFRHEESRDS